MSSKEKKEKAFHNFADRPSSSPDPHDSLSTSAETGVDASRASPLLLESAVERHGKRVFTLALRVTRDHHDAEDVFQEVFLRVWKMGPAFERLDRPESWAYRVTLNLALDAVDRRKKPPHRDESIADREGSMTDGKTASPDKEVLDRELRVILRAMVDRLPRAQQEVFVLRNDEGLSYREISRILDCPEDRARANFYQAMKSLRKRMEEAVQ
jgi:RNA polymerase sigma-70 factor (ECF subfamily)